MTVPTSNEEREALKASLIAGGVEDLHSWRCQYPEVYGPCTCLDDLVEVVVESFGKEARDALTRSLSTAILAVRRPPVSGDNAEAAAIEAERIITEEMSAEAITGALPFKVGFVEGAQWQASQPREVDITDEFEGIRVPPPPRLLVDALGYVWQDGMLPETLSMARVTDRNIASPGLIEYRPVTPSTPNQTESGQAK